MCEEDYMWRETVQWRNPSPSARRFARHSVCCEAKMDVDLYGKTD